MALTPAAAATLVEKGFKVQIEDRAGDEAKFLNKDYINCGVKVVSKDDVFASGKIAC